MKNKTIVSRILVALLALLPISLVLPALALEPSYISPPRIEATTAYIQDFFLGFRNPTPLRLAVMAIIVVVLAILSIITAKSIKLLVYRNKAKHLADEHFSHVNLTGLPLKLILAHFAEFSHTKHSLRTMERHFLDELYHFFLTAKSEELANLEDAAVKDKDHLNTRAAVYRNVLKDHYSYEDFLSLHPLDTEAARMLNSETERN